MLDIAYYRSLLRVDRNRLDDQLEQNAQSAEEIGREVARRTRNVADLKRELEVTEANIIARLKEADSKLSNPIAEKEARGHRDYRAAWTIYQDAKQELEEWEAVKSAWHQRGFDMKALGELYAQQYFVVDSVGHRSRATPETTRAAMRERVGEISRPRRRVDVDS